MAEAALPPTTPLLHQGKPLFSESSEEVHTYPEGGLKAWLVVVGAFCAMAPPIGMVNSMGALHSWISNHQLKDYSEASVGWIFSLHAFFLYVGSSQLGTVFDKYGVKPLVVTGSIGYFLSLFSLGYCEKYYQFLLSFGVLGGLSACCLFTPSVCAVGHWFSKRRAYATGIAYTSGGLGGIIFPLIILELAPQIGYSWAMRVISFVSGAMLLVSCFLLQTRVPPDPETKIVLAVDLKGLSDPPFAATTLAVFLVEFSIFVPITYISSYAIHVGIPAYKAYRLIAFMNFGSIPGRVVPGYFADTWGRFTVMIITTFGSSLSIFTLWLFCGTNEVAITAFAVLFGFWSGASISLTPVCVAQVCRIEDYGKRNGTAYSLSSFAALIGVPIAGALVDMRGGDYFALILFGGALYGSTGLAFMLARSVYRKSKASRIMLH